jgi:hypothetical protein
MILAPAADARDRAHHGATRTMQTPTAMSAAKSHDEELFAGLRHPTDLDSEEAAIHRLDFAQTIAKRRRFASSLRS